jgi:hypothetical protein
MADKTAPPPARAMAARVAKAAAGQIHVQRGVVEVVVIERFRSLIEAVL